MKNLRELRVQQKVSLERAASTAGLSEAEYLNAECRPYVFTVGQAMALSGLLKMKIGDINWHEGLHVKQEPLPHIVRLLKCKL